MISQMLFLSLLFLLLTLSKLTSPLLYSCNSNAACGCSTNPALVTRIIGGENASTNTWGWAVSLLIDRDRVCGGSILSSSWILTAAHCVVNMRPSQVLISAATNELFGWKQWRYASAVITHPQYDNETFTNDIALLKVSPPWDMTDTGIAKICLPVSTTEDYPPINSTLVAIGWGLLAANGSDVSETLQQVTLQRISYNRYICFFSVANASMQICAGAPVDGKGVCHGDSGGALMMFTSSRQWVTVGIVSYGYACALASYPSVYTRVTYYLDWIRSMNVTDAITVETITTTTTTTTTAATMTIIPTYNISNSTSDSLSCYQYSYVPFIVIATMLLCMLITI